MITLATDGKAEIARLRYAEWYPTSAIRPTRTSPHRIETPFRLKIPLVVAIVLFGIYIYLQPRQLVPALIMFLGQSVGQIYLHRRFKSLSDLTPSPSVGLHVAVDVQMRMNRVAYGQDVGVLSWADGWMVFEGDRCNFSLKPLDVVEVKEGRRPVLRLRNGMSLVLHIDGPWRLDADGRMAENRYEEKEAASEILRWARSEMDPAGASVFPPRQIPPRFDVAGVQTHFVVLTLFLFVWAVATAASIGTLLHPGTLVVCLPIALCFSMFLGLSLWRRKDVRCRLSELVKHDD